MTVFQPGRYCVAYVTKKRLECIHDLSTKVGAKEREDFGKIYINYYVSTRCISDLT